jgi:ribosomal protein S18 acetylase RimI-like enzyme
VAGLTIRPADAGDHEAVWRVFNEVVSAGDTYAFAPETSREHALSLWFPREGWTYVALLAGEVVGTYLLKANQPGQGSHVANCGYMVAARASGRGIGEALCRHSLEEARRLGFTAMQFNLVVSTNVRAIRLWQKCGFAIVGTAPKVFRHPTQGLVDAHIMHRFLVALLLVLLNTVVSPAAELRPRTVEAFERYVRAAEARMAAEIADPQRFLLVDTMPAHERTAAVARLRRGELVIERLEARDRGEDIDVPDGLAHHWVGIAFVPGATVDRAVALLQDYDRHADIYRPAVTRSRVLAREGDTFRVFLRFYMKKVIAVTVNSEHDARFTRVAADRVHSRIVSTRIAEVKDPDSPGERELPVGRDGGYLWRLNTYWRFAERDGGTYVQCESISLTRSIPFVFSWLVSPFVSSIPRESLTFTLETTRKTLAEGAARPP